MKYLLKTAAVVVFFFASCESSSWITSSWKAQNVYPKKYKKIVVLGLIRESDNTIREKMEQHIVGDLQELGYTAVCSCDEYNPKAFDGMNEQQAIDKLHNSGVDAVLTITLLDKTKEKHYVPGRINYSPNNIYYNHFWGYYHTIYDRINTEGYYAIDTKYFWESNFYDVPLNQLLYSVQSQSFDPSSIDKLGNEYGQMIVKNMIKNNVIANQKEVILKPM